MSAARQSGERLRGLCLHTNIQHPTSNFQHRQAGQSHAQEKAEFRIQNAESPARPPQATLMRPSSHLQANSLGGDCDPQATCMRPTSHLHATLKPPTSHPQATHKPPSSHLIDHGLRTTGPRTTDHGTARRDCVTGRFRLRQGEPLLESGLLFHHPEGGFLF
jgi:hypothetical protein